jgi:NHL repeat-containing protein
MRRSTPRRGSLLSIAGLAILAAVTLAVGAASAATGLISTIAGTGTQGFSGNGGSAIAAQLDTPKDVVQLPNGAYLIADTYNHRVRQVSTSGQISTVAGTGVASYNGDGIAATAAKLNEPHGVAPAPGGGFLIADSMNNRVRKVSASGTITTVAGKGWPGFTGDGGAATAAKLNRPMGVAPTADGGFLIADHDNFRIRKVSASGVITTVAGNGIESASGDGGPATAAGFHAEDVAATADGGFLIADWDNHRVRRVSPSGQISTVAGTGSSGFSGDGGPATAAQLDEPAGVTATPDGGFLVADHNNHRIRRVSPAGTITTVAGTGFAGFDGDGVAATSAGLEDPIAVNMTGTGGFVIADSGNHRIRFVDSDYRLPSSAGSGPKEESARQPASNPRLPEAPSSGQGTPVLGKVVSVEPVRGTVRVRRPGDNGLVALAEGASIPVGTLVDARRGAVKLTSASNADGATQTAVFSQGAFLIRQKRARRPVTVLQLRGGQLGACPRAARGRGATTARKRRPRRRLWGRGKGRFRTRGKHSAATVRGTIWLTEDRCDGTLTKVRRGKVAVRDFVRRRTVMVTAGHRYLARRKP